MSQGYIHSLESFGSADGPGVRYIIFFSGCAMRCQFCHNPDTWKMTDGQLMSSDELIEKALRYKTYWGPQGGITVSGGEFLELMKVTDLVMLDIKHIDPEGHKALTKQPLDNILAMAREMSDLGVKMWIRHVLVPERNDKDEYLMKLAEFIKSLKTVERVEVLPYHTLGVHKWKTLGIPYELEGIKTPEADRVENARKILGAV